MNRYNEGYEAAQTEIRKGENPQRLFNQSAGSLDQDSFDTGWQDACKQAGAVDPED